MKLLIHDSLRIEGGAERVVRLANDRLGFDELIVAEAKENERQASSLGTLVGGPPPIRLLKQTDRLRKWAQRRDWSGVEVVLLSGVASVVVAPVIRAPKVLYCHSPPRSIGDLRSFYLQALPAWQRPAGGAYLRWLRRAYRRGLSSIDTVVSNSKNVARRLDVLFERSSVVVYPPVEIEAFQPGPSAGFFLSTARLEAFKRVHLVVEAFMRLADHQLVVASDGSEMRKLRKLAAGAPNIRFTGWQDRRQVVDCIERSRATIYVPLDEDFGISPVESMAAGKPVIGVASGGLLETVVDEETGVLLPEPVSADSIARAVLRLDEERAAAMEEDCIRRSRAFGVEPFVSGLRNAIQNGLGCDSGSSRGENGAALESGL